MRRSKGSFVLAFILLLAVAATFFSTVNPEAVIAQIPTFTSTTSTTTTTVGPTTTTSTSFSTTSTSTSTTGVSTTTSYSYTSSATVTATSTTTMTSLTTTFTSTQMSITTSSIVTSTTLTSTESLTSPVAKFPSCLIATATFGSEVAPEVQLLRDFRDNQILRTQAGSSFMIAFNAWYYSFSPQVAGYENTHSVERTIMRGVLYPLIGILVLSSLTFSAASAYPEFAALLSGLVASSLIGAFYLGLPLSLLRAKVRRLRESTAQKTLVRLLGITLLGGIAILLMGELLLSSGILIVASVTIVLSALFLSATCVSWTIARRIQAK